MPKLEMHLQLHLHLHMHVHMYAYLHEHLHSLLHSRLHLILPTGARRGRGLRADPGRSQSFSLRKLERNAR